MRKLIAVDFLTLDGVMQSPGSRDEDSSNGFDKGGWITGYSDEVISDIIKKEMETPFDLILGRKTFDIWAKYWPNNLKYWPLIETANKYVISHILKSHSWKPVIFLNTNIVNAVQELKKQEGNDLRIYGSSEVFQFLLSNSLIDEIWLKTYPKILGQGKHLFTSVNTDLSFKLFENISGESGIVSLKYRKN